MMKRRSFTAIIAAWLLLGAMPPNAYADPVTITKGLLWYPSFPTPFDRAFGEFRLGSAVYSVIRLKLEVVALRDSIVSSLDQAGDEWLRLTSIPFTFNGRVPGELRGNVGI
jgi:hypothetical protein